MAIIKVNVLIITFRIGPMRTLLEKKLDFSMAFFRCYTCNRFDFPQHLYRFIKAPTARAWLFWAVTLARLHKIWRFLHFLSIKMYMKVYDETKYQGYIYEAKLNNYEKEKEKDSLIILDIYDEKHEDNYISSKFPK
ncbi:MAG: hypothetical protein H0T84_00365 [Tatlockia sp.]|nr:hypothetical protein [Tatlockia sp.]